MSKVDPNAWMLTFSDLVTLLLTFFVLLLTMRAMDEEQFKEVFGLMSPNFMAGRGGGGSLIKSFQEKPRLPTGLTTGQGVSVLNTKTQIAKKLKDFQDQMMDQGVNFLSSTDTLTMRLPNLRLFGPGSAQLVPGAGDLIIELGKTLQDIPYPMFPIRIEGYSDEAPVGGGSSKGNELDLSMSRALAVYHTLFDPELSDLYKTLRPVQYGVFGHGSSAKGLNPTEAPDEYRRVDIVIDMTKYNEKYPGKNLRK